MRRAKRLHCAPRTALHFTCPYLTPSHNEGLKVNVVLNSGGSNLLTILFKLGMLSFPGQSHAWAQKPPPPAPTHRQSPHMAPGSMSASLGRMASRTVWRTLGLLHQDPAIPAGRPPATSRVCSVSSRSGFQLLSTDPSVEPRSRIRSGV